MRLFSLFFCCFLFSCYTQQKANKQIDKAQEKYPQIMAKKASQLYPCKPIIKKSDSVVYKTWIRTVNNIDTLFDTIVKLDTNCKKVMIIYRDKVKEVIKQLPAIHDTFVQIDSANVFLLTYQRDSALLDKNKYDTKFRIFRNISIFLFLFIIALLLLYANKQKLY